jgi:hypothetical protein
VPERAGDEGRDGHERRAPVQADQVGGQRHLGRVELPVPHHPEEGLLHRQNQEGQVDAFGLDIAAGQRGGAACRAEPRFPAAVLGRGPAALAEPPRIAEQRPVDHERDQGHAPLSAAVTPVR